jgi:hypothetical protein
MSNTCGGAALNGYFASRFTYVSSLHRLFLARLSGHDHRSLRERRRVVASPAEESGLDETGINEHLKERPFLNGTQNSVRPCALIRHLLGRDFIVDQNVGHLEPTIGTQDTV